MRFLLLGVSWIFGIVFYLFYSLSQGKSFFGEAIYNSFQFKPLIFSLLTTSIIFILLGLILFFIFSNFKDDYSRIREKKQDVINVSGILFSLIFLFGSYYGLEYLQLDITVKINITFGIFLGLFLFSYILKKYLYKNFSLFIKLLSVLVLYLGNFYALNFSINYWYEIKVSIILAIYILFNFGIHFKYENLISLILAIITSICLLYRLYGQYLSGIV